MSGTETKGVIVVAMVWFSCCFLNVTGLVFDPNITHKVPEWLALAFFVMLGGKNFKSAFIPVFWAIFDMRNAVT